MKKINFLILIIIVFININFSCSKNDDYIINKGLSADSILRFESITPITAEADSNTQIIVRIAINTGTQSAANITLSTSHGLINDKSRAETTRVNLPKYVEFILKTGQVPGPVYLSAVLMDTLRRDTIIYFSKAYPDSILVQPDKHYLDKNTDLEVGIRLFRKMGYPSFNQSFLFTATDTLGNNVGDFMATDDYETGKKMDALFTPENDFTGTVILRAYVVREDGTKIVGSSKIVVQ